MTKLNKVDFLHPVFLPGGVGTRTSVSKEMDGRKFDIVLRDDSFIQISCNTAKIHVPITNVSYCIFDETQAPAVKK